MKRTKLPKKPKYARRERDYSFNAIFERKLAEIRKIWGKK